MVFSTVEQVQNALNEDVKQALELTLEALLVELGEIIRTDIYDSYNPTWDGRTGFLLDSYRDIFETYYWNNFGKGVGGGIRLSGSNGGFMSYPTNFVHGSGNPYNNDIYSILDLPSYLEIMNDVTTIDNANPFHFPKKLPRGNFWEDFLEWADKNFHDIFRQKFFDITGILIP